MELVNRADLLRVKLPGRIIQNAVGKASAISSEKMTVGFATYSVESGPMDPHNHAEETVVILDCEKGWVRRGPSKDKLDERFILKKGTVLHFDELEWHVFEYGEDGYVDIMFIYGQVDNIRPEEMLQNK